MIDNSRLVLYNNEIVKVSLFSRKGAKKNTMEAKKKLLTYAGLKALEEELENLKVVKRKEVAAKIKRS